jgi:hypothetical protein
MMSSIQQISDNSHFLQPHSKEILHGYVELFTNKKERFLQPRNQNAFALHEDTSFHLTDGLWQKHKTTNT